MGLSYHFIFDFLHILAFSTGYLSGSQSQWHNFVVIFLRMWGGGFEGCCFGSEEGVPFLIPGQMLGTKLKEKRGRVLRGCGEDPHSLGHAGPSDFRRWVVAVEQCVATSVTCLSCHQAPPRGLRCAQTLSRLNVSSLSPLTPWNKTPWSKRSAHLRLLHVESPEPWGFSPTHPEHSSALSGVGISIHCFPGWHPHSIKSLLVEGMLEPLSS